MSSNDLLLNKTPEQQGWVKWYVLCMLSIESCLQTAVWAMWGPIAQSAKAVYEWEDSTVNLMVNLGNIGTMLFVIPCAYVLDVKGLRISMLGGCFLQAVGNGFRIITTMPAPATWLIGAGQLLNGIGGTVSFVAPTRLSATWFARDHRATSTSVSILFASIGAAMAFVLGPALVTQPPSNFSMAAVPNFTDLGVIRSQIMRLNYLYFGLTTVLFLVVVVYFPDKPHQPPSITAGLKRYEFKEGFFKLIRHKWFWYIAFTFAIPAGVYGSWMSVLDVNLNPLGIRQTEAGWFGFYGSLGGAIAGMIIGSPISTEPSVEAKRRPNSTGPSVESKPGLNWTFSRILTPSLIQLDIQYYPNPSPIATEPSAESGP
ncbi:hypothetical protein ACJMK2_019188 [Sinanodonta woodiana]|uniref:Uncharacterized protein n=1 Tax=Sinanodonta woodiana TaxID=1069815 RepID=A0ABD3UJ24_SINWO